MERGNAKHGPLHDEEMAHEAEAIVRGAPQRSHVEQWRESEPLDDATIPADRPETALSREAGLRSELARSLSRDAFPADSATLADRLADADVSPEVTDMVSELPGEQVFGSVHELLESLGLNSVENQRR